MRWRKQVTSMRSDPRIKRLIRRYGSDGWTVYTVILDSIGDGMDPITQIIPYLQETPEEIAEDFGIDPERVAEIVGFCGGQGLLDVAGSGAVYCFKLYKYADEYFTKVQRHKEDYAERNKDVIRTYKNHGRRAAIERIIEYNPLCVQVLHDIAIDSGVTPEFIQSCSGVTLELLRQERKIRKNRERERGAQEEGIQEDIIDPEGTGKRQHEDNVYLSDSEYQGLVSEYGEQIVSSKIIALDAALSDHPRRYNNHYKTLRSWIMRDAGKSPPPRDEALEFRRRIIR